HLVDGVDGEYAYRSPELTPGANPRPYPWAQRNGDRAVGKTVQRVALEEHLVTLGPDLGEATRISWAGHHRGVSESVRGRLLVATPTLYDPNFFRTVVLVLEHGEDGAIGVVLNRPSETGVGETLPDWDGLASDPGVVFVGGPVSPEAAIGLARAGTAEHADGWAPLFGRLGTVDLGREPVALPVAVENLRVFAGYA